jgi:hypothetical protein
MFKRTMLSRGAMAVLGSLLVAGTVFAASAASGSSAASSHARALPPVEAVDKSAKPSESPEATETPEPTEAAEPADTPGAPLSAVDAGLFVARLNAAGITVTANDFTAMAAEVGVGGAVRAFSFAKQSGRFAAAIVAMFQGGQGWGQIAHTLGLNPGIGGIMSGGHGKGHAKGSAKTKGSD